MSEVDPGGITVRAVEGRSERSAFINLPWSLYSGDPLWVPPLKAAVRQILDVEKHPFYLGDGAEIELFLAWRGGHVVGRIVAILNHRFNRFHSSNEVHFGFFECIDDGEVARSLFGAVESWGGQRGSDAVLGPFNPSTNYECGLLIDGFERPPVVMMTYNPPYYSDLIEGAGFGKAKDLLAFVSPVQGRSLERLRKLAEQRQQDQIAHLSL